MFLIAICGGEVRIASAERIPILMFHHIRGSTGLNSVAKDLSYTPNDFVNLLDFVQKSCYCTVTFRDVRENKYPNTKKIIFTFDDGGITQWLAFQELIKRDMKGVFFPSTRTLERNKKYLSSSHLRIMSMRGMEIGSHGVNHPVLAKASQKKLEYEVTQSKLELERVLGNEVMTFCYPYGRYNKTVIEAVKSAGYHYARTTNERVADFDSRKNFELPIIYIHCNTSLEKLKSQL